MSYNRMTGVSVDLKKGFDQQVEEVALSPDGNYVYFTAGERGHAPIFRVPLGGAVPQKMVADVFASNLHITPDGKKLVFASSSIASPTEIYTANADGSAVMPLTSVNKQMMDRANLKPAEELEWTGALGRKIHGFIIKPTNFDAAKKYPLVVLIHGGPQGAWNDSWSYRWNPQLFAAAGYVVFAPNPRGSTGYGQKFVDEISADWGGKVYTDILNGVAYVAAMPYVDRERIGAAGGSYGGYMVNWIEGHNNDARVKFSALVSHAGVYNLTSMYGATEELWFPEWEFKGMPWTNPEMYAKWSPHMFVKEFKTPLLVIHG